MGHENAGVVEEIGENVQGIQPGDSVIMSFVSSCGNCVYCRTGLANHCSRHYSDPEVQHKLFDNTFRIHDQEDTGIFQMNKLGGFAEKQVVPADSLLVIPNEVPPEVAALIGCCVTTGFGGIVNLDNIKTGSTVAVFGCGGVGLNILEGAKSLNANKIIAVDISDHKLEFAYKFGATHVVNAKNEDPVEKIREITDGGVDYSFDSFGSPMIMKQAVESLGRRGTASLVGLAHPKSDVDLNMVDLVRNEKKVVGSFYGYASHWLKLKKYFKLNLQETNDLLYLLTMYGKVEKRHWEQQQKPKGHIYHSIRRLSKLFPIDKEVSIIGDWSTRTTIWVGVEFWTLRSTIPN